MRLHAEPRWWIYGVPVLFCLAFYWTGLDAWFYQDDFGWLNLRHDVSTVADLPGILFAPRAHGNIRPWSERIPFLVFPALFGMDPLPFRMLAFLTQAASLVLLGAIVLRLTGSRTAATLAPVLWTLNTGLAPAMYWTCIYNQILSTFLLLLPFWLLLRAIETGQRRYWVWQWLAFVLGFGALETNVVFPALATLYALACARKHLRRVVPMFAVSAVYAALHFLAAPVDKSGDYALHLDRHLAGTLATYWRWALGLEPLSRLSAFPVALAGAATAILTAALLVWTIWNLLRRRWIYALPLGWFLCVLSPMLPLRDHKMDYYLAGPAAGLGLAGAFAWAAAERSGWRWRTLAALFLLLYGVPSGLAAWHVADWHYTRSRVTANLVLGVSEIRSRYPGKVILLTGVDTDLFRTGIAHAPFRAFEIPEVWLAPGAEQAIADPRPFVRLYVRPAVTALRELADDRAVVVDMSRGYARNVTREYRLKAPALWPDQPN